MRHNAIVVTGPVGRHFQDVEIDKNLAVNIYDVQCKVERMGKSLVSPVVVSITNGYGSFFVAPDGSREGWAESAEGDKMRDEIVAYLDTLRYGDGSTSFDYVEVQFGDDDLETKVVRDSDAVRRA